MKPLKTLELFSGGQSFSKVMRAAGHRTFTVDIEDITADDGAKTDLVKDILDVSTNDFPYTPDIVWASPPCTCFSIAAVGKYWHRAGVPKEEQREKIERHIQYVQWALWLATKETSYKRHRTHNRRPFVFVENPVGMLRKLDIPALNGDERECHLKRHTITYCQYETDKPPHQRRRKATDIWTNAWWWKPRPACKRGDPCHMPANRPKRREQRTLDGEVVNWTGGIDNKGGNFTTHDPLKRAAIPPELFEEMLKQKKNI